jgi:hypothetical protein
MPERRTAAVWGGRAGQNASQSRVIPTPEHNTPRAPFCEHAALAFMPARSRTPLMTPLVPVTAELRSMQESAPARVRYVLTQD